MRRDTLRACLVSAVVGSVLTAIHCREMLLTHGAKAFCDWHVFSSYLVPFVVSLVSARLARLR